MGVFGLWNYENYLLNLLITSKFARNGLIILLMYLITALVRFHLSIILSVIFIRNDGFDLITPVIISILISMCSDTLFRYVETHRVQCESLVDHIIKNYSFENFIFWKRCVLLVLFGYILIGLYFVQITNRYILISLAQTTVSFMICDFLEQKLPQTWYNYLVKWWDRPQINKFPTRKAIIEDYIQPSNPKQLKRRHSLGNIVHKPKELVDLLPPKPPTPPMINKE